MASRYAYSSQDNLRYELTRARSIFWIGVLFLSAAIAFNIASCVNNYGAYQNIDASVDRAAASETADVMAQRLNQVVANMRSYGVTEGHSNQLFKNPNNDVALDLQALEGLADRAREITVLPPTSVEYSTALAEIRETLYAIQPAAYWYELWRDPLSYTAFWLYMMALTFGVWWLIRLD